MGLNLATFVQTAVATAKAAAPGWVRSVTYRQVAAGTAYNPITDGTTAVTTDLTVDAVRVSDSDREVADSPTQDRDGRFMIAVSDLPTDFVPSTRDQIIDDGRTYRVFSWRRDPSGAMLVVTARAA